MIIPKVMTVAIGRRAHEKLRLISIVSGRSIKETLDSLVLEHQVNIDKLKEIAK